MRSAIKVNVQTCGGTVEVQVALKCVNDTFE